MTKILLVEDDKSLREIYGVRLLAEGYDIVSAGDGEEALAMAIKERPDLIISDVMMPKISGFDMLDILRSTTETRDIKVIMMTALSSDDQRARGEQLGADRYLVKSQVGIEDVVRTVHEVMEDNNGTPAAAPITPSEAPATPIAEPASAPTEMPAPQPTTLPQPTAPFSSPKPDNLGERVINPIENTSQEPSVASKIEDELAATASSDTPVAPVSFSTPSEPSVAPATPAPTAPSDDDSFTQATSSDNTTPTEPVVESTPVQAPSVAPGELPPQPQPLVVDQPSPDNEQRAA